MRYFGLTKSSSSKRSGVGIHSFLRREIQDLGEVQIQCDETAPFGSADLDQNGIFPAAEPLLTDKADVVTGVMKDSCDARSEVFIQLDLQRVASMDTSKYLPRAVSAP